MTKPVVKFCKKCQNFFKEKVKSNFAICSNCRLPSTLEDYKKRIIQTGMESASKSLRGRELQGAMGGFNACYDLHTMDDFKYVLSKRHKTEMVLQHRVQKREVSIEYYFKYRYATIQIKHVYDRLNMMLNVSGQERDPSLLLDELKSLVDKGIVTPEGFKKRLLNEGFFDEKPKI